MRLLLSLVTGALSVSASIMGTVECGVDSLHILRVLPENSCVIDQPGVARSSASFETQLYPINGEFSAGMQLASEASSVDRFEHEAFSAASIEINLVLRAAVPVQPGYFLIDLFLMGPLSGDVQVAMDVGPWISGWNAGYDCQRLCGTTEVPVVLGRPFALRLTGHSRSNSNSGDPPSIQFDGGALVQAFDAAGNQVPLEQVIPEPSLRWLVLCALVLLHRVHRNRRSAIA